eukprot:504366_1
MGNKASKKKNKINKISSKLQQKPNQNSQPSPSHKQCFYCKKIIQNASFHIHLKECAQRERSYMLKNMDVEGAQMEPHNSNTNNKVNNSKDQSSGPILFKPPWETYHKLTWQNIGNAITHELYEKISVQFMNMVNNETRYDDIDRLLNSLKKKIKIDENEVKYLRELIRRTKNSDICEIDLVPLFNFKPNLIADVFSVYTCFLFSNFQFQKCDTTEIKTFLENKNQINHSVPWTTNLYPQYIIDDDMYSIWKYFFAASHLVDKLKTMEHS